MDELVVAEPILFGSSNLLSSESRLLIKSRIPARILFISKICVLESPVPSISILLMELYLPFNPIICFCLVLITLLEEFWTNFSNSSKTIWILSLEIKSFQNVIFSLRSKPRINSRKLSLLNSEMIIGSSSKTIQNSENNKILE